LSFRSKFETQDLERIRPPYRPDDDIPFKAKGWRLLAAIVVVLVALSILVGVILWLRWVFRGIDQMMIYLILLFFIIIAPLVFAVWHYFNQER